MKPERKEELEKGGIDVSGTVGRCMGNADLFERLLKKFLSDSSYENLVKSMVDGNKETMLISAHTLKGISGNLGMTGLYELLSKQVEAFRADDWEMGVALMPEITEKYEAATAAIRGNE